MRFALLELKVVASLSALTFTIVKSPLPWLVSVPLRTPLQPPPLHVMSVLDTRTESARSIVW